MMAYWPPLANDASASPVEREIGRFQRDVAKVVVSDRLTDADISIHPATVVPRRSHPRR